MNIPLRTALFSLPFLFFASRIAGAELKPDGLFQGKNASFSIPKNGRVKFTDNGGPIGFIYALRNENNEILTVKAEKITGDPKTRSVSCRAAAGESEKPDSPVIPMNTEFRLLPDNRTLRFIWRIAPENAKRLRKHKLMLFFNNRIFGKERNIIIDNRDIQFDTFKRGKGFHGKAKQIVLNLPADRSRLPIMLIEGNKITCSGWWNQKNKQYSNFIFSAEPKNGTLVLDFDLDSLPETTANSIQMSESINIAPNQFRLPDFSKSRNLLQNPSFEDGIRFWTLRDHCKPLDEYPIPENGWFVDESTAAHGKRSYRHAVFNTSTCMPSTLAYPTIPGEFYTFSFYAKTDAEGGYPLDVTGSTQYGVEHAGTSIPRTAFHIGNNWERYHFSFKAPNKLAQFTIWIKGNNLRGMHHIWLDAFQLEKGKTLTAFTQKPVSSVFETTRTDNLHQPGTDFKSSFRITSEKPVSGTLEYTVKDIFKRIVKMGKLPFRTAGNWVPDRISIPDGFRQLDYGAYLIETKIITPDFTDLVFDRLNLIEYLDGRHDLKNQFGILFTRTAGYDAKQRLNFWHHVGVGVLYPSLFNREITRLAQMLKFKTGIPLFAKYFPTDAKQNETDFLGKYNLHETDSLLSFRDSDLPAVEEYAFKMAKRFPWNSRWKSINEPSPTVGKNDEAIRRMIKILRAADRGIKRANPKNILIMPEMPGVYPEFVAKMWKWGGPKLFPEGITSHLYLRWPEEPDIDKQTENMIRAVNDPNARFAYPESSSTFFYHLPELSVSSLDNATCGDFARAGHLATYDLGYGEQLALANKIRFRLPIIKRKAFFDTQDDFFLDMWNFYDMGQTSSSLIFSMNTLGRLLGGARFIGEPVFGEGIRCYLFEDAERRPVAAIWNYAYQAYFTEKQNPYLALSGLKQNFELLNVCGGHEKIPADRRVMIGFNPVFIRGEAGKADSFRKEFERLDLIGGNSSEFKLETEIVDGTLTMRVRNVRAKQASGRLTVRCDGKTLIDKEVAIPSRSVFAFREKLPASDTLKRTRFLIRMKTEKTETVKTYNLEYFDIHRVPVGFKPDGTLEKWSGFQAIEIPYLLTYPCSLKDPLLQAKYRNNPVKYGGKKDFSAKFYAGYDSDNLYLTVCVKDNVFRMPEPPVKHSFRFDSLQLYFDSYADARNIERPVKGWSQDDQAYDICTLDGKTLSVYRSLAPYVQLAFNYIGEETRIHGTFRKTDDGYIYDLILPQRAILPVVLKKGSATGMSLLLNDNDADYRKRGLSLNPRTEPFQYPEHYPVMQMK